MILALQKILRDFFIRLFRILVSYADEIRIIGREALLPYRNFLRWNLSKITIFAYSMAAGILFSIPFLAGIVLIGWNILRSPSGEATKSILAGTVESISVFHAAVLENFWSLTSMFGLLILVVTIFSIFVVYGYFLLGYVYRAYVEKSEFSLHFSQYFLRDRFFKFLSVTGWASLYVAIPLIVGMIALAIIVGIAMSLDISTAAENIESNALVGGIVALIILVTGGATSYVVIRTGFSFFPLMADDSVSQNGKTYLQESIKVTRGKFWKILFLLLPFAMVLAIAEGVIRSFENELEFSRKYSNAVEMRTASGTDFSDDSAFTKAFLNRFLEPEDIRDAVDIFSRHEAQLEGIDREFFEEILPYLDAQPFDPNAWIYETFFNGIYFLLFDGAMAMVWLSIWLRLGGALRLEKAVATKPKQTVAKVAKAKALKMPAKKPAGKARKVRPSDWE